MVTVLGLCQNQPTPGISEEGAFYKNFNDIVNLLPKDLDLATFDRVASYAPPAPETHNGGNAIVQTS